MRTINLNHWSDTLTRVKDIRIVMPDNINENTKVVLLLHGYCGDHNDWSNLGGAIRLAEEYQMVFVMPSAENSYYLNIPNGDKFFDYISKEVVEITTKTGTGNNEYDTAIKISFKLPSPSNNVVKHQFAIITRPKGIITEKNCPNTEPVVPCGL